MCWCLAEFVDGLKVAVRLAPSLSPRLAPRAQTSRHTADY